MSWLLLTDIILILPKQHNLLVLVLGSTVVTNSKVRTHNFKNICLSTWSKRRHCESILV